MDFFRNFLRAFSQSFKKFLEANFSMPRERELTPSGRPRLTYIDLAKGICIFLVVSHHADIIPDNILGLRCLRMPLYFFLSGLFFRDYGSIYRFLIKKFNRLIVPFFFFLTLGGLAHWSLRYDTSESYPFYQIYIDLFLHSSRFIYSNGALWFLEALFEANLLFWLVSRLLRRRALIVIVSILIGGIGVWTGRAGIMLPFYGRAALMAFPLFTLGALAAKTDLLYRNEVRHRMDLIAAIVLLSVSCTVAVAVGAGIDFYSAYMSSPVLLTYILSIGMVLGLLALCRWVKWLPVISYIGRYSLIVLGLHTVIRVTFEELFPAFGPHGTVVPFLVSFLGSWIAIPFMKALFPHFTAQTDLIPDSIVVKYFRRTA